MAGAGVEVAASGVCVTEVKGGLFDPFDDLDMVDKDLAIFEDLRDSFLKKLKDMLPWCEECFVDGREAGWYDVDS